MQISNKEQLINGLPGFNLIINYTARTKKFSIPLPDFMSGPLGMLEVTGSTQDEVEKLFKEKVEAIKKVERKTNKVIIYDISIQDDEKAIEIKFRAAVANELKSTVGTKTGVSYEILPSSLLANFRTYDYTRYPSVPWSPEMEQWFAGIRKSLLDVQAQLFANGEFIGATWENAKKFTLWAGMKKAE